MQPNILPTIFTAAGNYTPYTVKATEATEGLGLAARGASRSMNMLSVSEKGVSMSGVAFLKGTGGILAMGTGMVLAGKAAMDFEQQMGNVATLVDTTRESISLMGKEVLKMGQAIPKPISDLTESLYQIRSAGIPASKAIEVLGASGKLATAGLGTTTEAANMITSAINVFKKESLDANTAADVLFKTVAGGKTKVTQLSEAFGKSALAASDVGVSFRELMAMTAAMTSTGVQTAEAQTGITQALISLNKRTGEMITIQEKLTHQTGITGAEFINFAGSAVGAMKMIDEYATTHRMDLFKIYGRKEGALVDIGLTRNQYQTVVKLMDAMRGANEINEAYSKQMKTSAAQFQVFKNGVTQLGASVGTVLLPPLNSLLKVLNPIFNGISNFAENHKIITQTLLIGGAVWKVNSAFGIWNGLLKANNYLTGLSATLTGRLTGSLLAEGAAAKGAADGVAILNGAWKGVLLTVGKVAVATGFIYSIWKLMDKKDEAKDKMAAILPHLPEGVDKKKFENQFDDIISPGFIPLMARIKGKKSTYPQAMYDSLVHNYYDLPKARQDSTMQAQDSLFHMQNLLGDQADSTKKSSSTYETPFIQSAGSAKSKTDELLAKIYEVLKSNPQAAGQPAYAQAAQSAKRVPQTVYSTFNRST